MSRMEAASLASLEAELSRLEERRAGLSAEVESGDISDHVVLAAKARELEAIGEEVEGKTNVWLGLAERAAEANAAAAPAMAGVGPGARG